MKTFVLIVSKEFPKTHKRAGESTGFVENIQKLYSHECSKIYTLRANYKLWKSRAKQINSGQAILSIRYWSGKPYNSKQIEICTLEKIGIEKLHFEFNRLLEPFISSDDSETSAKTYLSTHELAKNDGLVFPDFKEWFKGYNLKEPMAIIHFTEFRYSCK